MFLLLPHSAWGQSIPGSADSSRVVIPPLTHKNDTYAPADVSGGQQENISAPLGSEKIGFVLKGVRVDGNTAINESALQPIYRDLIGHDITLDKAWDIANQITNTYRQSGYFLSRAYVPAQEIEDGVLKITVVEGFIEDINISGEKTPDFWLNQWTAKIKSYHPIRIQDIEAFLLELNKQYGVKYRAVFRYPEKKNGKDGAVDLDIISSRSPSFGSIAFNNHGSRFLGANQVSFGYAGSFLSGQNTNISFLGSMPLDELKSLSIKHQIPIAPKVSLDISANYAKTNPGYTLKVQDIAGKTISGGFGVNYQWLLGRDKGLSTRIGFDAISSKTDILSSELSSDDIRVLRLQTDYYFYDDLAGANSMFLRLSRGIDGLGASEANGQNLSRAEAQPDFSKIEFGGERQQSLPYNFQLGVSMQGQYASAPLYSSEEFGYGGQTFGRAYDNSEIVGDKGVEAGLEVRYLGITPFYNTSLTPYVSYDIGKVWNLDTSGQPEVQSAASAGAGVRFASEQGITGSLGVAFPLTKPASDPLYGGNASAPRLSFQVGYSF